MKEKPMTELLSSQYQLDASATKGLQKFQPMHLRETLGIIQVV